VKATQNQQQDLLHLHTLASEIERKRAEISAISSGAAIMALRAKQLELANELINAHNALEAVELELKRANEDLALVEQRVNRDKARLNETASAKDAQGIQNELASLGKRQSELEDITLVVIERQEAAKAVLDEITDRKNNADAELLTLEAAGEKEVIKLQATGSLLVQQFNELKPRIAPELIERYTKIASRGVPIGRLEGRDCGACRMTLGVSAFESISSLPADEFATCPECSALLVRG